jgi:hypothetical protein
MHPIDMKRANRVIWQALDQDELDDRQEFDE